MGPEALAAVQIAGSAIGAVVAISAGRAQSAQAKLAAEMAMREATLQRQVTAANEAEHRRGARKLMGQQIAAAASRGVDVASGSPLEVLTQTAADTELDALKIRWGGEVGAARGEADAAAYRLQARSARTASYFAAANKAIGGAVGASKTLTG